MLFKRSFMIPVFAVAVTSLSVVTAGAATITQVLIDYDDGIANGIHDVAVRNGGFESPVAGDMQPFSNTDNWINVIGLQSAEARRNNLPSASGSHSSVDNLNTNFDRNFGIDTGFTISEGDTFDLSFSAVRAFGSDSTSEVTVELFYTDDDTIGGAATVIGAGFSVDDLNFLGGSGASTTDWETFTTSFGPIALGDGAIGKSLFLRFEQTAGPGFTKTDNWFLSATSIVPEPSSYALGLIAVAGVALFIRRRKAVK